jgi:hypothetical protein
MLAGMLVSQLGGRRRRPAAAPVEIAVGGPAGGAVGDPGGRPARVSDRRSGDAYPES